MMTVTRTVDYASKPATQPSQWIVRAARAVALCVICFAAADLAIKWECSGVMHLIKVPGANAYERILVAYVDHMYSIDRVLRAGIALLSIASLIALVHRRWFRWWGFVLILAAWIFLAGSRNMVFRCQFEVESDAFPVLTAKES